MAWELPWEWFWVILSALLIVGEIFTAGFFILPFSIGAAFAAGVAWFGGGLVWQWAVFLVVSVGLLLPLKRFADRITPESTIAVAADRMIGKVGVVIEAVQPHGVAPFRFQIPGVAVFRLFRVEEGATALLRLGLPRDGR